MSPNMECRIELEGSSVLATLVYADSPPDLSWKRKTESEVKVYYKELNAKEAYLAIRNGSFSPALTGVTILLDGAISNLKIVRTTLIPGIIFNSKKSKVLANIGFKNPVKSQFSEYGLSSMFSHMRGYEIYKGSWFAFNPDDFDDFFQIVEEFGIKPDIHCATISYRQYLKLKKILAAKNIPFEENFLNADFLKQLKESSDKKEVCIPNTLLFDLYPYQKKALNWLQFCDENELGCILADDMGLGKTKTTIALLASTKKGPNIIICPSTLLANWSRELKSSCPSINFHIYHGPGRAIAGASLLNIDLIVTSYGTFKNDFSLLSSISWNIVALDEAQKIKNPGTEVREVMNKIIFKMAIAITGTPFENKPEDLWSLMDFIEPGFLGDRYDFDREYGQPILNGDENKKSYLKEKISLFMLRRLKKDVLNDLPDKTEIEHPIEMSADEACQYREYIEGIASDDGAASFAGRLVALRQLCCHPYLKAEKEITDPSLGCNKYQRLIEILKEAFQAKEKVLVFTSFHRMNDLIYEDISSRFGVPAYQLDGRINQSKRYSIIDSFTEENGAAVMVLNPIVGGVGINLVAANHVVHYNREWNPAIENQASDRVYRIGQKNKVFIHYLFYIDTIDEIISDRLNQKRDLAQILVQPSGIKDRDRKLIMEALSLIPKGLPEEDHEILF
ncbi:MAG: DEAD/DEAH box helicase [Flavobacteriaceae bacterium]|jgi:SNF2 family DNA or RNA helicase|nr:DEAD/DEAH box helicase [Flavobacteriaceae bacterium]